MSSSTLQPWLANNAVVRHVARRREERREFLISLGRFATLETLVAGFTFWYGMQLLRLVFMWGLVRRRR